MFLKGKVIATKRTDYKNFLKEKEVNLKTKIKTIMQEQHKGILKAILDGSYDKNFGFTKG